MTSGILEKPGDKKHSLEKIAVYCSKSKKLNPNWIKK